MFRNGDLLHVARPPNGIALSSCCLSRGVSSCGLPLGSGDSRTSLGDDPGNGCLSLVGRLLSLRSGAVDFLTRLVGHLLGLGPNLVTSWLAAATTWAVWASAW